MADESLEKSKQFFTCDDCDQRFGHLSTLQAHMGRAHPNIPDIEKVKKPLKCQFCNEDFAEDFLQTHEEYCDNVVTENNSSSKETTDQNEENFRQIKSPILNQFHEKTTEEIQIIENDSEFEQRMEEVNDVEVLECSTVSQIFLKNCNFCSKSSSHLLPGRLKLTFKKISQTEGADKCHETLILAFEITT